MTNVQENAYQKMCSRLVSAINVMDGVGAPASEGKVLATISAARCTRTALFATVSPSERRDLECSEASDTLKRALKTLQVHWNACSTPEAQAIIHRFAQVIWDAFAEGLRKSQVSQVSSTPQKPPPPAPPKPVADAGSAPPPVVRPTISSNSKKPVSPSPSPSAAPISPNASSAPVPTKKPGSQPPLRGASCSNGTKSAIPPPKQDQKVPGQLKQGALQEKLNQQLAKGFAPQQMQEQQEKHQKLASKGAKSASQKTISPQQKVLPQQREQRVVAHSTQQPQQPSKSPKLFRRSGSHQRGDSTSAVPPPVKVDMLKSLTHSGPTSPAGIAKSPTSPAGSTKSPTSPAGIAKSPTTPVGQPRPVARSPVTPTVNAGASHVPHERTPTRPVYHQAPNRSSLPLNRNVIAEAAAAESSNAHHNERNPRWSMYQPASTSVSSSEPNTPQSVKSPQTSNQVSESSTPQLVVSPSTHPVSPPQQVFLEQQEDYETEVSQQEIKSPATEPVEPQHSSLSSSPELSQSSGDPESETLNSPQMITMDTYANEADMYGGTESAVFTDIPPPACPPVAAQVPLPVGDQPVGAQVPLPTGQPVASQVPLPPSAGQPVASQVPLPATTQPVAAQVPLLASSAPVAAQVPLPASTASVGAQVPLPTSAGQPVASQVPLPTTTQPVGAQVPLPAAGQPVAAQVPLPVSGQPVGAQVPLPGAAGGQPAVSQAVPLPLNFQNTAINYDDDDYYGGGGGYNLSPSVLLPLPGGDPSAPAFLPPITQQHQQQLPQQQTNIATTNLQQCDYYNDLDMYGS